MRYTVRVKSIKFLRVLPCAIFSLFVSVPTLAAPALTLPQILARHNKAAGATAARKDKTAHKVVYTVAAGGLSGTLTTWDASGHRARTEVALGPLAITTGSDGKRRWEQDGAGNVRILGGEELSEDSADAGFSLEDYDPLGKSKSGTKVILRPGKDKVTGCYVLDVLPKGGSGQTVYIDSKTYLVRQVTQHKNGMDSTVKFLAYQSRFGSQIPSRMQIGFVGLPLTIEATLASAVTLPTVSAALFQPPTLARDWRFLSPGVKEASLPFTSDGGEVVVAVSVNGHPLRLLLDSGAGSAFLSAEAARTAGLTTEGDLPALGYGGAAATGLVGDATLQLAQAVMLSHQVMHVIKDEGVTKQLTAMGVDGAVGYEIFSRFTVRIDYLNKILTLSDPALPQPASAGAVALPLKLETRTPTILASVDSKAAARFLVDTGDTGALHLYTPYATANGLLPKADDPTVMKQQGVGVGGTLNEQISPGHALHLGTLLLQNVPVATMTGGGISGVSSHAGGLGNGILSRFLVTFDYTHGRLTLALPQRGIESPRAATPSTFSFARSMLQQARSFQALGFLMHSAPQVRPAVAVPAATPTLAELLAHHLEALGGRKAVEAITNTRVTADVETGGIKGTIQTVFAAPDKEYEEDNLGILHITQGYDGKTAWQRDTNGNIRPLAGEELRDLRVQLYFDTNSYVIPGRIPGKMTLRPTQEPVTGNWIVDALPDGGKPTTLFFDPKTWFIVKEQHLDDNIEVTTTYDDYRTVDDVRFPYSTKTTNGTPRYDITGTVTKIENNVVLPPGLFKPPTDTDKNFGFVMPGKTSATVPFDMDDGEIAFDVKINGQTKRVFLDTGASGIAISQKVATELGLKSSGVLEARGYGGSADLHPILIDTFEVPGAVKLTSIAAIALDLPASLDAYFTRPSAGFVGYDLLSHFVVRIDFAHKKLTFIDASTFKPKAVDGRMIPIELDNNVPSLFANVDALPTMRFLIDTGDESHLRLYSPFVAKYGLAKKYPHGTLTLGGGIGGVSKSRQTRIGSFTVAGVTLKGVPTDFSLDPKGGASQVLAGSLGSGLLSRFVLTLDYPHSRAFFAPTAETKAPFETRTTGIELLETKDPTGGTHLAVADLRPEAPAAKAGLHVFDEILAIDGKPVQGLSLAAARLLLAPRAGLLAHSLRVQSTIGAPRMIRAGFYDPLGKN